MGKIAIFYCHGEAQKHPKVLTTDELGWINCERHEFKKNGRDGLPSRLRWGEAPGEPLFPPTVVRDEVFYAAFGIARAGIFLTLGDMSKFRNPATGEGYLGEIMVHKVSHAVGVVENVVEAKAGWPPQITLKLKDGSVKKGSLSDFRDPNHTEREQSAGA